MGCGSSKYEGKSLTNHRQESPEIKKSEPRWMQDEPDLDENSNMVQPFEKLQFDRSVSTEHETSFSEYATDEEKENYKENEDSSEDDEQIESSCTDLIQLISNRDEKHRSKITMATPTKITVELYNKGTISKVGLMKKWDTCKDGANNLDSIYDVAFLSDDHVMVSQDRATKSGLQVYDVMKGTVGFELGEGMIGSSRGICPVDTNTIAVVDPEIRSVKFLNQDQKSCRTWEEDLFESPSCIQITRDDKYIVSDVTSKEKGFQMLTSQGKIIRSFHMRYYDSPRFFTLDSHDRVIVAEQSSNSIVIFDKHGKLIRNFAKRGSKDGQLNGPCGIAVDHMDNILIADANNFRVAMFSPDGRFIKHITSQLDYKPRCLAFRDSGHLAVASTNSLHFYEFYETKSFA